MAIITEIVGLIAAIAGTSLMLPQVIKTIRTRKVDDISYGMLWLYFVNCILWLLYGTLINAWPVMVCNSIALIISLVQLFLKAKFSVPQ